MKEIFSSDKGALVANRSSKTMGDGLSIANEPFVADKKDSIFALFTFLLGFLFIRWVFFSWQGWGVSVFTIAYSLSITIYFRKKGINIPVSAYFWLASIILIGISYSLYMNKGLEPWRSLLLFCSAVYYVIIASGRLILSNTSNWIFLDGVNGLLVIPFKNFGCQYKSLSLFQYKKKGLIKQILSVALGLLLALSVTGMVFPLLMRADSGGFYIIASHMYEFYQRIQNHFMNTIVNIILAIPVAAYLFGLVAGCAHGRGCKTFKRENIQYAIDSIRILDFATVYTALGLICCLYLLFIGSQIPYFFSAFVGKRPDGWQIYSEYARSGFFELCQIATINLFLLLVANVTCKKSQGNNTVLKILNIMLSMITLLLIATALSKMGLYIKAYGLSIRRLLPCIFMLFLTVVFVGIIILQKRKFSIIRLSVITAVFMICVLSLLNPDSFVANYNANRYLSGTLGDFDVSILYQSGPAGVDAALRVYEETDDGRLKAELRTYIDNQKRESEKTLGLPKDSLQNFLIRQKTK
ncbi:MAG: DUF4173 domain-containing protein [Clostridiales bacterium]|nr:DUF4173 domain-containing protein [Clostridiales bacterium]